MWVEALRRCGNLIRGTQASRFFRNRRRPRTRQRSRSPRTARSGIRRGEAWTLRLSVCCIRTWIRSRRWARTIRMARRAIRTSSPLPRLARRGKSIPLLAEEGWRDSLIEAGAPGAKREPDRAKPQLWSVRQNRGCADLTTPSAPFRWLRDIFYGAATPPLRGGEFVNLLIKRNTGYFLAVKLL